MVLPLLAVTWMSAVLAVTDRRSALFQILFAVFDSLEGFVIVMVHCILRREVGGPGPRRPVSPRALGNARARRPQGREPGPRGAGTVGEAEAMGTQDRASAKRPSARWRVPADAGQRSPRS